MEGAGYSGLAGFGLVPIRVDENLDENPDRGPESMAALAVVEQEIARLEGYLDRAMEEVFQTMMGLRCAAAGETEAMEGEMVAALIGLAERRAVIVAELDRIADSCGYAVPVMELREERDLLTRWAERRTPAQLAAYRAEKNEVSIDGLPALG